MRAQHSALFTSHFSCAAPRQKWRRLPLQTGILLKGFWIYFHKILQNYLHNTSGLQMKKRVTEKLWASSSRISLQLPLKKINSTEWHFTCLTYNFPWDHLQQQHSALLQLNPHPGDLGNQVPRCAWKAIYPAPSLSPAAAAEQEFPSPQPALYPLFFQPLPHSPASQACEGLKFYRWNPILHWAASAALQEQQGQGCYGKNSYEIL